MPGNRKSDADSDGVIVAGPQARARAREGDEIKRNKQKADHKVQPVRDTRDTPAENPKVVPAKKRPPGRG